MTCRHFVKRIILIPMIAVSLSLVGCGDEVKISNEENDLIAEYVGGTLMKYSYANEWKYRKLGANMTNFQHVENSVIVPTSPAQKPTSGSDNKPETTPGKPSTGGGSMNDLASAFNMGGMTVNYTGCSIGSRYPQGSDLLSVRATTGKEILAIEFDLINNTDETICCNTAPLSVVLKVSINGSGNVTEYATMLKNDINTLSDVNVKPGESYGAVALFMVKEGQYSSVDSLTLTIGGQGVSSSKITLK